MFIIEYVVFKFELFKEFFFREVDKNREYLINWN